MFTEEERKYIVDDNMINMMASLILTKNHMIVHDRIHTLPFVYTCAHRSGS